MSDALTLSTLPSELQLCILEHLSTRRLLCRVTRLSKYWFSLVCELVRQRTVRLLERPGVGIVFETTKPSDYNTISYTLRPQPSGPFEPTKCGSLTLPQLVLAFTSSSAMFEFHLDDDEYFESFLWSVSLSTHRSIQYRVSPPASPKLLAFDRTVRYNEKVEEGMDRLRRCEFPEPGSEVRTAERELTADHGPALWLKTRHFPVQSLSDKYIRGSARRDAASEFRAAFEGLRMDAASIVVACEDKQRSNDLTVFLCK